MRTAVCLPAAVRSTTGIRFWASDQSSPTDPSSAAPAALKYRRAAKRMPSEASNHGSIRSDSALDSPYGFMGWIGDDSVTGSASGMPYTAQDDENTIRRTPVLAIARKTPSVPPTLSSK